MIKVILSNGAEYSIPISDTDFFTTLASRMGWKSNKEVENISFCSDGFNSSWINEFAGKWKDSRKTDQIIKDIHEARTSF